MKRPYNTQINPTQNSFGGFSKAGSCAGYFFRYAIKENVK